MTMRRIMLAGAACASGLLPTGCRESGAEGLAEPRSALTVQLISPETAVWPEEITASGRVVPWQESIVSSEAGGCMLEEIFADVGDSVRKGQLLARFNDETARAAVEEMEAAVRAGRATLQAARDQLARSRKLAASGAVSGEALEQHETAVERCGAELSLAMARLTMRRLELRHTHVTAADDGVISSRTAAAGTVYGSGAELFRLIRQNRVEWRAEIPGKRAGEMAVGRTAIIDAGGGKRVRGTIRRLAPSIDPRTLDGICHIDLPDPGPLRAGMYPSGVILTGESPALHVPESAIIYRDGYTCVAGVSQDRTVRLIKVTALRRRSGAVEISGVSAEDRLVLSGGAFLNDGDAVRLAEPPAGGKGEAP